ncbi:MAG TPA: MmpS family transport accessory protein [Deltaproteobacteria bacterium]|nr:MmpS family transport accessory protein [Deltaproteobacteria bacterium]
MITLQRIIFSAMILTLVSACSGSDDSDDLPGTGDHKVRYEVEGGSGVINEADITYIDENGIEQTITDVPIPWVYSFLAEPNAALALTAILHGSGTTTLYATITVDSTCWIDDRTFVTESNVSVSGTPEDIMETCPNHGGTTVQ